MALTKLRVGARSLNLWLIYKFDDILANDILAVLHAKAMKSGSCSSTPTFESAYIDFMYAVQENGFGILCRNPLSSG